MVQRDDVNAGAAAAAGSDNADDAGTVEVLDKPPNRGGGRKSGPIVEAILKALHENEPMTRRELCEATGYDRMFVSSVVSRMNRTLRNKPKRLYIKSYTYEALEGRLYPRAQYALGDLPDARRPKADPKARLKRWRDKKKMQVSSVWEFAMPRRARAARKAAIREGANEVP